MNGIICINKPQGFTSFDAVAKLRGILKTKKLGHGGTLDPMATGVLPVFIGSAAKACDIIPDNSKSYFAGFRLGEKTDTQDISGKIISISDKFISERDILSVIPEFTGGIMQTPPMYSAVKVNGKRLYDLARQGIETERKPREIEIYKINLEIYDQETREGKLYIECSKGTYIRTIINDIGEKLGCGGVMTSLVRLSSNGFTLGDCHSFEEIQQAADSGRIEELIIPVEYLFRNLPGIRLNEIQTRMYKNGVKLDLSRIYNIKPDEDNYAVYGFDNNFIGTAYADRNQGILRVGKNLVRDGEKQ